MSAMLISVSHTGNSKAECFLVLAKAERTKERDKKSARERECGGDRQGSADSAVSFLLRLLFHYISEHRAVTSHAVVRWTCASPAAELNT